VIPIKDRTIRRRFPFVNLLLIFANIAVFLFEWSLPDAQLEALVFQYGFIPSRFFAADGWTAERILPLISSMFLHGGWFHLISNMLSLWIFGDNVEDRMGHLRYLLFYLLAGIAAALTHGLLLTTSPIPTVGASGAIAGVLGAYLLLFPRARVVTIIPVFILLLIRDVPAILFIGFWFVSQLFYGIATLDPMMAETGIAWWAHIGGFVVGFIFAIFLGGPRQQYLPAEAWERQM
jgi:membrane associated rhomboid family serine protease